MAGIRIACGLGIALLVFGCSQGSAVPSSAKATGGERSATQARSPAASPQPGAEPDRAAHMQATFWMAVQARDAVIAGDLKTAKDSAHELAVHDYTGVFPDSWKHWVGEMQKHAGEIAVAADMDAAAQSVGLLALACGDCHYHQQGGPEEPRAEPLPWQDPPDSIGARMERHYKGAEQLWLGLVDPSEDAWRAGTITLTRAPLQSPEQGGESVDERAHVQVEGVRALAKQARAARTFPERARIYGELIATCAHCHTVTPMPGG